MKYRMQLQGQLWVTGKEWVDWMSWYPEQPAFRVRVYPDPMIQAKLDLYMPQFIAELDRNVDRLLEKGVVFHDHAFDSKHEKYGSETEERK